MSARGLVLAASVAALVCATPGAAGAQGSRAWIVLGGTSTTLRGDCQEDCPAHGTGDYLHTGGLVGVAGVRLNPQVDAGIEITWVRATTTAGEDVRSTFLLATGQFRPLASHGFFLRGGMGMAFIRNFAFDPNDVLPPITSKALGLTYGAGWAFRRSNRLGWELFATQHVAALGDFETAGVVNENVVANYWSLGAGIVIR